MEIKRIKTLFYTKLVITIDVYQKVNSINIGLEVNTTNVQHN
jgi:hypothetical protein